MLKVGKVMDEHDVKMIGQFVGVSKIWENNEMLKAIVQSSPLSIIVLNKYGEVELLNYGAEVFFGWKEEEVIGRYYPIFPEEQDGNMLERIIEEEIIVEEQATVQKRTGLFAEVVFSSVQLFHVPEQLNCIVVMISDVSKRKKAELVFKQSVRELKDIKFALDQSSIIALTDPKGTIRYVNDKFCEISKYSRSELLGADHRIVNSGYHSKQFFKEMWATIGRGKVWRGEVKNRAKDGNTYWVDTTIVPFLNDKGLPYQYISIRSDISKRKRAEERVRFLAYYDELTSLPNRRMFKEELTLVLERAAQTKEQVAVLSVNLDRFKIVNDTLGYRIGNLLLKGVAERLQKSLTDDQFIARHGGDEFLIFLPNSNSEMASQCAKRILMLMRKEFYLDENEHVTTCSIGISMFPEDGDTFEELTQKADIAINRAKKFGKDSYQFFEPEMDSVITRELTIEKNLRKGLEKGEFKLVYQPKMNVSSGEIIGIEALLRWHNQELGHVSPAEFIPIAEETGLIVPIGEWVIREACMQLRNWQEKGYKPLVVSVNLSVRQFQEASIVEVIEQILQETKLAPHWLELEITENFAVHKKQEIRNKLNALKALGVTISIDDFGKGYSSLSYLSHFPVDTLKIDKTFIDEFIETGDSPIARAIIAMAHSLRLSVVAEGVEVREQLIFLKDHRCDAIQGYYFSRPLPPSDLVEQFLRNN